MHNFCFLAKNTVLAKDLIAKLKSGADVQCQLFTYRSDVIEYFTNNRVNGMVLIDHDFSRDIGLILKGLPFSLNPHKTQIIILTEDLVKAAEVFQDFKQLNIRFISMHSPIDSIVKEMKLYLLNESVPVQDTKNEEAKKFHINMDFLKVFVDATKDVVAQMSGDTTITHQKPQLLSSMNPIPKIALRGKLAIESEYFKGTFFISFPLATYLTFVELILGEKRVKLDDDIKDLVLEVANIVYGQSKRILNSSGYELQMKIPSFFEGEIQSKDPVVVIPYSTKFGPFYIKVAPNLL